MAGLRGLWKALILSAVGLAILVVVALVSGLGLGHLTQRSDGLVQGKILWYWCQPACSEPIPFPDTAVRFHGADGTTWTAVAKPDGSYAVSLPVGRYSVSLPPGDATSGPSIVQVTSGETTRADFLIRHISG
jgi:hypothetical protein